MPEPGIGMREFDAGFDSAGATCTEKDDSAVLFLLRQQVGQQQLLPRLYGDAEEEQGSIRIHM